jgi:putative ABC transport system ATP-binding protein
MNEASVSIAATPIEERAGPPPVISIAGLQHYYGEGENRHHVLRDIVLEIPPGEIVIMTGPSGSGKTTLLTLIGTLRTVQAPDQPAHASLRVLQEELKGADRKQLIDMRRQIGFIFQAHNLFESLTAIQNVMMAAELFDNVDLGAMRRRGIELLGRLGLGERIDHKPAKLSGGQKQRVAIARALVHDPPLILADEPTAALDKETGRKVVTLFEELADEGRTILMVTHDNRILDVADRIIRMVDGQITSNKLVSESEKLCTYLKSCQIFSGLTVAQLTEVADQMFRERHPAGTTLFNQGDVGDKFYIIHSGGVDVRRTGADGKTETIAHLGEGKFFGEVALLEHQPRNATIVTTDDTVLYALDQAEFHAALSASPTFEEEVRKVLFDRR